MRLGLQVNNFTWSSDQSQLGDTFGLIVERAERAGFYSLWVDDHFFQVGEYVGPAENEMLEGWSTLAFVAGRTNRIKLGTLVSGVTYRHPGVLVKMATTLDVLSHGRTYFGIGTGYYEEEHRGLGIPFPPLAERYERLEETVQIALHMWEGDQKPYEGKHYRLARPLSSPQSVQQPHPPILIGGSGERKTLRLVAKYADACNLYSFPGIDVPKKLSVLRQHCLKVGRPYEHIEKTTVTSLHLTRDGRNGSLTPSEVVDRLSAQAALGIDQVIFSMPNVTELEPFDLLASHILPEVEKIPVAGRGR